MQSGKQQQAAGRVLEKPVNSSSRRTCIALPARPQLDGNAVGPICTRKSTVIIASVFIQFHRATISQIYPGSFIIGCKRVRVRARGQWRCNLQMQRHVFHQKFFLLVFNNLLAVQTVMVDTISTCKLLLWHFRELKTSNHNNLGQLH